jgi:TRAP-type transport system small permease protein
LEKLFLAVESGVYRPFRWLVYFIYTLIILATFVAVIFRYVLNDSLIWAEELARYLFVWLTFLGSAIALRRGLHIGLDLLLNAFPPKGRRALETLITCLICAFLGFVLYASVMVVQVTMRQRSSALQIPMGLVYLAIPVGCSLMLLSSFRRLSQLLVPAPGSGERRAGREPEDGESHAW